MADGLLTPDAVSERLAQLAGQRVWRPALGVGSFLTVEFGDEIAPKAGGRSHGAWHLWLYCCAWRLDGAHGMLAGSEDDRAHIAGQVAALDGATVTVARLVEPSAGGLQIEVTDYRRLTTFAIFSTGYEHWHLYGPDGTVVTAGPGSSYSSETGVAG